MVSRAERRAAAREAAKLLLQSPREKKRFRWGYTLALLAVALSILIVLLPPQTLISADMWLLILFGVLAYPALHFVEWLLPTGQKRLTYPGSILLLAMVTFGFGKIALPKILRATSTTVVPALRKLSEINPRLSADAIRAGSAVASTVNIDLPKEMHGKVLSSVPDRSSWTFAPISANTGPDNYQTIGLVRQPDVTSMERIEKPVPKLSEYGPAFLLVKGLTATLDGFHLKNVVFQDMHLIYHGGPLILENAYFFHCEFQFDPNDQEWRLLSAIATGGWVTFSAVSQ